MLLPLAQYSALAEQEAEHHLHDKFLIITSAAASIKY